MKVKESIGFGKRGMTCRWLGKKREEPRIPVMLI